MPKKFNLIISLVVLIFIVLIIIALLVPKETQVIKIGVILPLTGKGALLGEDVKNGISLAEEKVNTEKKIVKMIYEDSKCDPKEAVSAYKSLTLKGVNLIIGAACSSSTLAIAPLAEEEKVILLTPASAADSISQAGDFIFRNHVFMSQKSGKLGEFAAQKYQSIATIYDQSNDAFVIGEQSVVDEYLEKGKGNVVVERQAFSKEISDFRSQLTKIKAQNSEAIYVGALMPQAALIVKQIAELGINAQILSDEAMRDEEFMKAVGNSSEGIIFTGSQFSRETNSEFWDLYIEKVSKDPNIFAAQCYDCLMILADILKDTCQNGDSVCVKDELYKIKDYPGASGQISFDANGDALKEIVIRVIKNGQFVKY